MQLRISLSQSRESRRNLRWSNLLRKMFRSRVDVFGGRRSPLHRRSDAGDECCLQYGSEEWARVRVVLFSQEQAENAWKANVEGAERLVFTRQQFYADAEHLYFQSIGSGKFSFQITPKLERTLRSMAPLVAEKAIGNVSSFSATLREQALALSYKRVRDAVAAAPVASGPKFSWRKNGVARAPGDEAFDKTAEWSITLPKHFPASLSELFLDVHYVGDVARLSAGGKLLEDDFYNGLRWRVGLKRFDERPCREIFAAADSATEE